MRVVRYLVSGFTFLLCSLLSLAGSFAFAAEEKNPQTGDDCSVCGATPYLVSQYLDFAQEVLSSVQTVQGGGSSRAGEYETPGGLFSQGPFSTIQSAPDKKSGLFRETYQGLRRNITAKMQGIAVTTMIMTHLVVSPDAAMGFAIIFQPKPIIRDRKKLQDLDTQISDKLFQLGLAGGYYEEIVPEHRALLNDIIKKYQGDGKLFAQEAVIAEGATYGQLIRTLRKLTTKHKTFIAIGRTAQFGNTEDLKEVGKGKLRLTFGGDYGTKLDELYSCSRPLSLACNTSFRNFGEDMKDVMQSFNGGAKDAGKRIKDSVIRLQTALQGIVPAGRKHRPDCDYNFETMTWEKKIAGKMTPVAEENLDKECELRSRDVGGKPKDQQAIKDFLQREHELLSTQYGVYVKDATFANSLLGQGLRLLKKDRRMQFYDKKEKETQSMEKNLEKEAKKQKKQDEEEAKTIIKELMSAEYGLDEDKIASLENYRQTLLDASMSVVNDHTSALEQAMLSESTDITKAIYAMVAKIRYSTHMIKDLDNPQSLVNNLGEACEGQCRNLGGVCWSK